MYDAPRRPPTQCQRGIRPTVSPDGRGTRSATLRPRRAMVPTTKEMSAARRGCPMLIRSCALIPDCTGRATPIRMAQRMSAGIGASGGAGGVGDRVTVGVCLHGRHLAIGPDDDVVAVGVGGGGAPFGGVILVGAVVPG